MSKMTALPLPHSLIIWWQASVFALLVLISLLTRLSPDDRKCKPIPEPILPGRPGILGLNLFLFMSLFT